MGGGDGGSLDLHLRVFAGSTQRNIIGPLLTAPDVHAHGCDWQRSPKRLPVSRRARFASTRADHRRRGIVTAIRGSRLFTRSTRDDRRLAPDRD
jgi:hypothetical protein